MNPSTCTDNVQIQRCRGNKRCVYNEQNNLFVLQVRQSHLEVFSITLWIEGMGRVPME